MSSGILTYSITQILMSHEAFKYNICKTIWDICVFCTVSLKDAAHHTLVTLPHLTAVAKDT